MRRRFVRRLPRPVRWLWFAILAVVAALCVGMALGLVLGDAWLWPTIQLSSILAGPLAMGLLVVVAAGMWSGRGSSGTDDEQLAERQPARPPNPEVPLEVAIGHRAGQAVADLARSREGKLAIRQTARLVRAVRTAARSAPGSNGAHETEDRSGREPTGR